MPEGTETILIVSSTKDVASVNIAKQILSHYSFKKTEENFHGNPIYTTEVNGKKVELVSLKEEPVCAQNITEAFPSSELIVFISRHSSVSGTPTLSVHTPGNLGEAMLGGISRKVSISPANAMRDALETMMRLKEEMKLGYEVCYECTHHGPSLNVPTMFVELGSSLKEWKDLKAAEVVAHASMKAILNFGKLKVKALLGVGGPHYSEKFTKMALKNEVAFGHIIPKYAISSIDSEILKQCVERTLEKVELAVLDWKGIKGEDKPKLAEMLEEIGLRFQKV